LAGRGLVPIVGVVGGIGGGKSLVSEELVKHGGYLVAGDVLGHEALRQPDIKDKVIKRWGRELLNEQGEVQRRRLGLKVFADAAELRALEALVFPWIGRRIDEEILKARRDSTVKMIVLDAAVMMEAGWDVNCDKVIFVDAPREARLKRLLNERGWSTREVEGREAAQMPVEAKRRRADAVIDNSGTPEQVAEQIEALLRKWSIVS
jgi:dephospho-CoA kinase